MLGLRVGSSGLGSNADEIENSYKHFIFTVIRPLKKTLLKSFNMLAEYKFTEKIILDIVPEAIFAAGELVDTKDITPAV